MKILKRLLKRPKKEFLERQRADGYLHAYSQQTDQRVIVDPHAAVGGMWEEIGRLQFDFLVRSGLRPHHTMLDIGCGTLRGGRHFIQYLDPGGYTGIDVSPGAIEYATKLVEQEGLAGKRPRLLVSANKDLKFREFQAMVFDVLLAQSVFTHLRPEHITECFRNVGTIMHQDSVFFFTFREAPTFQQTGHSAFRYPSSFFHDLADQCGFDWKDRSGDYPHPRKQKMVRLSKKR